MQAIEEIFPLESLSTDTSLLDVCGTLNRTLSQALSISKERHKNALLFMG